MYGSLLQVPDRQGREQLLVSTIQKMWPSQTLRSALKGANDLLEYPEVIDLFFRKVWQFVHSTGIGVCGRFIHLDNMEEAVQPVYRTMGRLSPLEMSMAYYDSGIAPKLEYYREKLVGELYELDGEYIVGSERVYVGPQFVGQFLERVGDTFHIIYPYGVGRVSHDLDVVYHEWKPCTNQKISLLPYTEEGYCFLSSEMKEYRLKHRPTIEVCVVKGRV